MRPPPGRPARAAVPRWRSPPGAARHRSWTWARVAGRTSRRSCSWPSPPRSPRSARLRLRPREEGRCFFQELILHPQPAILILKFLHARSLHRGKGLVRLRVLPLIRAHPVAQGPIMNTKITGHHGDRLAGLDHHLHGLSLELRAEPPALLGHGQILSVESPCPRSLVHLRQIMEPSEFCRPGEVGDEASPAWA